MTPPESPSAGSFAKAGDSPPAVSSCLQTLTQRRDFQRAARGKRVATPGFILQMFKRPAGEAECVRVGFTCSKKVGNAVARNRAKRRLREIARLGLPTLGREGHDYVLIGRHSATAARPFDTLQADFSEALGVLHGDPK